jgi:hypothetical protein
MLAYNVDTKLISDCAQNALRCFHAVFGKTGSALTHRKFLPSVKHFRLAIASLRRCSCAQHSPNHRRGGLHADWGEGTEVGRHYITAFLHELGRAKCADDLRLPMRSNVAVARKRRQHIVVAEVLRPGLVLLRRLADLTSQQCQGLPETVWVKIGQAGRCERVLKARQ